MSTPTPVRDPEKRRQVDAGAMTLGIVAIVTAVATAAMELTQTTIPWDRIDGWQIMAAIGLACVVLGLGGLLVRRR